MLGRDHDDLVLGHVGVDQRAVVPSGARSRTVGGLDRGSSTCGSCSGRLRQAEGDAGLKPFEGVPSIICSKLAIAGRAGQQVDHVIEVGATALAGRVAHVAWAMNSEKRTARYFLP